MGEWLGELEHVVLLAVAQLRGAGYGVGVREEIARRTGRQLSLGAIYATVSRLESKGLVSSRLGEPTAERGGRAKRLFRVEPAGARVLAETRARLEGLWEGLEVAEGEG